MHEGLGQLGKPLQDQLLGPVVHFDGRDHRRNLGRNRPGHCGGNGGPIGGNPIDGSHGHMLGGGVLG